MLPPASGAQVLIWHLLPELHLLGICQEAGWCPDSCTNTSLNLTRTKWARVLVQVLALNVPTGQRFLQPPEIVLGLKSSTAVYFSCCNEVSVGFKINLCLVFILAFTSIVFLPQAFTTDFRVHWAQHPLRPEFAESTYFLYKVRSLSFL